MTTAIFNAESCVTEYPAARKKALHPESSWSAGILPSVCARVSISLSNKANYFTAFLGQPRYIKKIPMPPHIVRGCKPYKHLPTIAVPAITRISRNSMVFNIFLNNSCILKAFTTFLLFITSKCRYFRRKDRCLSLLPVFYKQI